MPVRLGARLDCMDVADFDAPSLIEHLEDVN
jgi:hypothetical protein